MKKQLFNNGWTFQKGLGGGMFEALMGGAAAPKTINLPHDAMVRTPRRADAPSGGGAGFFELSDYTYVKHFNIDDPSLVYVLEFEGAYHNAMIYLNGSYLGQHDYGYGGFALDATGRVHAGDNEIKVILRNASPSGRWYNGGGLYRDVYLCSSPRDYIDHDGVELRTLSLEPELAVVRATVRLKHRSLGNQKATVTVRLLDAQGETAAESVTTLRLFEGENAEVRLRLEIANPQAWDAEHPHLYRWEAVLTTEDGTTDRAEGEFGVRTLQLDSVHGLRVNGQTVKLRGGCIHHDSGILGGATFAHAEERRIRLLKEAGYNAVRCAHNPAAPALLRACDRLGMYVMDEITDVWTSTKATYDYGTSFAEHWEEDVTAMVRKDINHPSVILYSIGNEIPEAGDPVDIRWGQRLNDKIHQLDDSRFTLNSLNLMMSAMEQLRRKMAKENASGGINEMMNSLGALMGKLTTDPVVDEIMDVAFDQTDLVGLNYAAARYELEAKNHPQRILVGSETNPRDLAVNWPLVEKLPTVIGDFCWTATDYLGEVGIGRVRYGEPVRAFYSEYPWVSAACCDIDLIGDRTAASLWRERIWGVKAEPAIAVQNPNHYGENQVLSGWSWKSDAIVSWTWPGCEEKPVVVEIMADADEVELFQDGVSLGRKSANEIERGYTRYELTYRPGVLRAVAYRNGEVSGESELRSAGAVTALALDCDRMVLTAGAQDIAYLTISAVDAAGVCNAAATEAVHVTVTGAGELAALGTANPATEENYYDDSCHPYHGRVLAILRSGLEPGELTVTVESPGCAPQSLTLRVEA